MGAKRLYTDEQRKQRQKDRLKVWRKNNIQHWKQYREDNKEQIKESSKRYDQKNREKLNKYKSKHRAENKERYNTLARERHDPVRQKIYDWKRKYKLTPEQFQSMLSEQNRCCATCKTPFTKSPQVDHCHLTGKVRGLLCGKCNRGLGSINDNIETLQNMIAYILAHEVVGDLI